MADIIKVTPEQLKTTAASLEATGNEVKKVTSQMLALVSGISPSVWSGEASHAFIAKFKGMDGDVNKMCKRLSDQSQHLGKIADAYKTAEDTNKSSAAKVKKFAF